MKKAVISGATGLVGSHLVAELLRGGGYAVRIIARSERSLAKLDYILGRQGLPPLAGLTAEGRVAVEYGELDDIGDCRRFVRGADIIFHCAAQVSFIGPGTGSEEMVRGNVRITHNLLTAALGARSAPSAPVAAAREIPATGESANAPASEIFPRGCPALEPGVNEAVLSSGETPPACESSGNPADKPGAPSRPLFVHVSSIAALGTEAPPALITEATPFTHIAGASAYARSKFLSENEVWRFAALGLPVVVVNPSVVIGDRLAPKGENNGINALIGFIGRYGFPLWVEGQTGFVGAPDVARAMVLLAARPASWGRRYIVSAENLAFRALLGMLTEAAGKKPPRIRVAPRLVRLAARFAPGIRSVSGQNTLYDGAPLCRATDFAYTPIPDVIASL